MDFATQNPVMAAILIPVFLTVIAWSFRLEGKVGLHGQRLDHHSETQVSIQDEHRSLKASLHELDIEIKKLNSSLAFIQGHMQSETEHKVTH